MIRRFFKIIALILIGAFVIVSGSTIIAGQLLVPYIPLISPQPLVTGYLGYYAGILALCLIPMILIARAGFGLVWNHKFDPKIRRIILATWVVSFIVFTTTIIFGARNFAFHGNSISALYNGPIDQSQPLHINISRMNSDLFQDQVPVRIGHSRFDNGRFYVANRIHMNIEPTEESILDIGITDSSKGSSRPRAKRNTKYINHKASYMDNSLKINNYYSISGKSPFRGQYRTIDMKIPIGQKVIIEGSTNPYNWHNFKEGRLRKDKTWIMTENGLIAQTEDPISE